MTEDEYNRQRMRVYREAWTASVRAPRRLTDGVTTFAEYAVKGFDKLFPKEEMVDGPHNSDR